MGLNELIETILHQLHPFESLGSTLLFIGFVLFIIGMAAVESDWWWFPALCMATGGLLVHIGEGE